MTQDMTHCMNKDMARGLAMTARTVLILLVLILTGGNTAAQVHVNGSVYGGGNLADVKTNTAVNIGGGQIDGNVFGGGNESKSLSNATVTLIGDAVIYGDVFGGGNKADVQGSATVNIQEKM